jgi:CRP-like cAMP-binding protein
MNIGQNHFGSQNENQALLAAVPMFATLSLIEIQLLMSFAEEIVFSAGTPIVVQGQLIDSIYVIQAGEVEVTAQARRRKKLANIINITQTPLGILTKGDTIGLSSSGFFSNTGMRTASVTALTQTHVLKLNLKALQNFWQQHPQVPSEMADATEQILRVSLIKQSLPFNHLSPERLMALALQVEELNLPANSIVFQQGEAGDRCYFIREGQIEIVATDTEGTTKQLALLNPPALFGEATLITRTPRNATARAVVGTTLLLLKHEYLAELIANENAVAQMMMNLMVDRSRPQKNAHIIAHTRTASDKQKITILKNPDNGKYFTLSPDGWFIWQQMNGKKTMQEITMSLAQEYDIFAPDIVAALITKLAQAGFIVNIIGSPTSLAAKVPLLTKICQKLKKLGEIRFAFSNVDQWITKIYHKIGWLFFTNLGKIFLNALIALGFLIFALTTKHVLQMFQYNSSSWLYLLALIPLMLISVALHEMGHALTTKSFGHDVHYMGIGWNWFVPVAFTDTSDMWLATRGPRIAVNLAGVYTDILVAGIASLSLLVVPNHFCQVLLWLFALFTYISAFRMLSPLAELDGYYVLMDIFDRPKLRHNAVLWLVKGLPLAIKRPGLLRLHLPEISYWLACLVFLILLSLLTVLVQEFLFKLLHYRPANPLLMVILPFVAVLVSSLKIVAEIRRQAEK